MVDLVLIFAISNKISKTNSNEKKNVEIMVITMHKIKKIS